MTTRPFAPRTLLVAALLLAPFAPASVRAEQPPLPCHANPRAILDMAIVGNRGDIRVFIDIFTDVSGLFVINNESGWYEGWMIHDLRVAPVNRTPRPDGHAQFGTLLPADAAALQATGGNRIPGEVFTTDGKPPRFPSANDHF